MNKAIKHLSFFLALTLMIAMLPTNALAGAGGEFWISDLDDTIPSMSSPLGNWTYDAPTKTLRILTDDVTLLGIATIDLQIVVDSSVTLLSLGMNATIKAPSGKSAITFLGSSATIETYGGNFFLTGGNGSTPGNGIYVNGPLTVTGIGTITATGGDGGSGGKGVFATNTTVAPTATLNIIDGQAGGGTTPTNPPVATPTSPSPTYPSDAGGTTRNNNSDNGWVTGEPNVPSGDSKNTNMSISGMTWNGQSSGLTFTVEDATPAQLIQVMVDFQELTRNVDYTVRSGSCIVTLKESFLSTLPQGDYAITLAFSGFNANAIFKVGTRQEERNAGIVVDTDSTENANYNPNTGR